MQWASTIPRLCSGGTTRARLGRQVPRLCGYRDDHILPLIKATSFLSPAAMASNRRELLCSGPVSRGPDSGHAVGEGQGPKRLCPVAHAYRLSQTSLPKGVVLIKGLYRLLALCVDDPDATQGRA